MYSNSVKVGGLDYKWVPGSYFRTKVGISGVLAVPPLDQVIQITASSDVKTQGTFSWRC